MSTTADTERVNLRQALIITDFYKLTKHSQAEDIAECFEQLKPYLKDTTPSEKATFKKIILDYFTEKGIKNARDQMNAILFPPPLKAETTNEPSFLVDDEPDENEQNGDQLFREVIAFLRRHVVISNEQTIVIAMWIAHCYRMDLWTTSPLLLLTSASKSCGKSTLIDLITALVPKPLAFTNTTSAFLYRVVEAYSPTLLIDEAEHQFTKENPELVAIVNAGHRRSTAYVPRCEGDNNEPKLYSSWAPKVVAMIGKSLADTTLHRSIVIEMKRKRPDQTIESFRPDRLREQMAPIRRRLRRWSDDHRVELMDAAPELPAGLDDRGGDNSRPLVAIAEAISSRAAKAARTAIQQLAQAVEDQDAGTVLLSDIQAWFDEHDDEDVVASETLVEHLVSLEERPWPEWRRGQPLTKNALARILKPFGIVPTQIRMGPRTLKGYSRRQFEEAWMRYNPATPPDQPKHRNHANKTGVGSPNTTETHKGPMFRFENAKTPIDTEPCFGVSDENPRSGAGEKKPGAVEPDPACVCSVCGTESCEDETHVEAVRP